MSSSSEESNFSLSLLVFETLERCVETYLRVFISPFLLWHEVFYSQMNKVLRGLLDKHEQHVPTWFTANFVTYGRTVLIVPCLQLLAWGWRWLPSAIVLFVDFGDFFDGVLARYWNEKRAESDDGAVGKDEAVPSSVVARRNASYGGFVDAVCDKAFVVPCWIYLLSAVGGEGFSSHAQYAILWSLIILEIGSGCIRFKAFFTSQGVPAPAVVGFDFSSSAVKADHVGKAKQTFEMVGTALFMLPYLRVLGVASLFLAVPLAYESVRRKITKRVVYVAYDGTSFDHTTLRFWSSVKGLGSHLMVGVPGSAESTAFSNAVECASVDSVLSDAPQKIDSPFMRRHGIDFFVTDRTDAVETIASEAVLSSQTCLVVGKDLKEARVANFKPSVERM